MKEFGSILGAGAFGGMLSFFWSITLGVPLKEGQPTLAAIASVFLGAGAAVIGIYVVAKTDRRDLAHALGFAVLCGFSWQVVYDAGLSTIDRHDGKVLIGQAEKDAQGAKAQIANATTPAAAETVLQNAAGTAAAALQATDKAGTDEARKKAVDASLDLLKTIETSPSTLSPEATSTAIEQIATSALDAGHQDVAEQAVATLQAAPPSPERTLALEKIAAVAEMRKAPNIVRSARIANTTTAPP